MLLFLLSFFRNTDRSAKDKQSKLALLKASIRRKMSNLFGNIESSIYGREEHARVVQEYNNRVNLVKEARRAGLLTDSTPASGENHISNDIELVEMEVDGPLSTDNPQQDDAGLQSQNSIDSIPHGTLGSPAVLVGPIGSALLGVVGLIRFV